MVQCLTHQIFFPAEQSFSGWLLFQYVMYSKPRVKALLELIYVCWLNSLFVNTMLPQMLPRFLNEANKTAPTAHTTGMTVGVEIYSVGINAHKETHSFMSILGMVWALWFKFRGIDMLICYVFSMGQVWIHPKCIPNHSV